MSTKIKQGRAAQEMVESMYAPLQQFSEEEQDGRLKDTQKIGATAGRSGAVSLASFLPLRPAVLHLGAPQLCADCSLSSLILIEFSAALTIARFLCTSWAPSGPRPTVISNGASRLFSSGSLLQTGRLA